MSDVNTEEAVSHENEHTDRKEVDLKPQVQSENTTQNAPQAQKETEGASGASSEQQKLKIDVLLKPAGDAPIMKKKKWAVDRSKRMNWVSEFIKKYIKLEKSESIFLYVNQSFSPSPDTEVGVLFDCFGSDGKLVLHYCRSQAWG